MKVKLGDVVDTEFGRGPVVALSDEWCVVLTDPKLPRGNREAAVPWSDVTIPAEAGEVASAIVEHDVADGPKERER